MVKGTSDLPSWLRRFWCNRALIEQTGADFGFVAPELAVLRPPTPDFGQTRPHAISFLRTRNKLGYFAIRVGGLVSGHAWHPGGCQLFHARNSPVTLLQTAVTRWPHVMISGEYRRLPGGLVRRKRWSNGPPWLCGSARLGRLLCRATLALSESGAKKYTLHHQSALE